jgi:hypothetical protein
MSPVTSLLARKKWMTRPIRDRGCWPAASVGGGPPGWRGPVATLARPDVPALPPPSGGPLLLPPSEP